jgi:hypothetical protein
MEDELAGGFGMVIPDIFTNKKDIVLKLFYDHTQLQKILTMSHTLKKDMGGTNYGHKMEELHGVSYSRLLELHPKIAMRYKTLCIQHKMPNPELTPDIDLPILKMRHNGIDISFLKFKKTYICRLLPLLEQFEKLFYQTFSLYENKMIHADIRDLNLMIDIDKEIHNSHDTIHIPDPRITIIDFDLKMPFSEYTMTMPLYNKPPEFLLPISIKNNKKYLQYLAGYSESLYDSYADVFKKKFNIESKEQLRIAINNMLYAMEKNARTRQYKFGTTTVPTIDNFGLGFCLLHILTRFYPTDQYELLNTYEQKALDDTVKLLMQVVSFNVYDRPLPDEVASIMHGIYEDLKIAIIEPSRTRKRGNAVYRDLFTNKIANIVSVSQEGSGKKCKHRTRKQRKQRTRRASKN